MAGTGRKSVPTLLCWRAEAEHPVPTTGLHGVFSALPRQGEQLIRLAQTLRASSSMPKLAQLAVEVIQIEPFLPLEFSPCSAAANRTFWSDFSL